MENNEVVLSIHNLAKTYQESGYQVKALKQATFQLHKGEFIAVMGTSGSGKSTLLNLIGALDEPSEGTISVHGNDIENIYAEPQATLYRSKNIGFIFQSYNLLKDLTVEENIALPLILKNESQQIINEKTSQMLDLVGLSKWKKHRPVQLSGGQQQRVAIGRALITSPPILLADEPTGNLDYNTSNDILHVMVEMKEKLNQSIILVTHDPYVATFADRVIFFHDGRMVEEYKCIASEEDMEHILTIFKRIMEKAR